MIGSFKQSATFQSLVNDAVRLRDRYLTGRDRKIRQYLAHSTAPKLHLGASSSHLDGWLGTDIDLARSDTAYLDATLPFPLPSASFDAAYAEHMIEHIDLASGRFMLRECRRILKPGGVLRIATPDLKFVVGLYGDPSPSNVAYIRWIADRFLNGLIDADAPTVMNNAFRAWGHQYIYDEAKLETEMRAAGFDHVERRAYNVSPNPALHGIENHAASVGDGQMVELETMILEAW